VKVEMNMYYLIRSYHNDGMSIRAIAKTLVEKIERFLRRKEDEEYNDTNKNDRR